MYVAARRSPAGLACARSDKPTAGKIYLRNCAPLVPSQCSTLGNVAGQRPTGVEDR
jgi:hypothetical protein